MTLNHHTYADGRPYRPPRARPPRDDCFIRPSSITAVIPVTTLATMDWPDLWQATKRELQQRNFAISTLRQYHRILRAFRDFVVTQNDRQLHALRPAEVTPSLVTAFLHRINRDNISWSWLASHTGVIRTIFDKLADRSITTGITTPKRGYRLPEVLSPVEIGRLIKVAPTLRDRLLIGLMYGCGLRVGEVCTLRWSNVDTTQNVLRIVNPHSDHCRELPIPQALRDVLAMGVERCPGADYVFPGAKSGKALTARVMERHIAALVVKADLTKPVSCRTLRHSYAVECLRLGMSVEQLRVNLGHLHIESTLIYQRCLPPSGLVSPADTLPSAKSEASRASATQGGPGDGVAVPSCPDLPPNNQPIAVPFPGLADNATGFFAMLRARLHDRFLALKAFVNTT